MKIYTSGETTKDTILFATLFNERTNEPKTCKDDDGNTMPKLAADGRPVFRTNLKALRVVDGQVSGEERNTTLALLTQQDLEAGKTYHLSGKTWITHYITDGNRLGVSIVVETVKPVQ